MHANRTNTYFSFANAKCILGLVPRLHLLVCLAGTVRRILILVASLWNVFAAAARIRCLTWGFCIAIAVFALILAIVSGVCFFPLFHAGLPLFAAPILACEGPQFLR